jgi:hypothetical protein
LIPNRVLIPEDIKLLKKDNKRVEAIVKKITEVFYCCLNSEILDKPLKIKSWEDTQELVHQYKYEFDFINIHYNHPQIKVETHQEELGQTGEYWAVYPPYLTIDLIKTRGLNGGYIIDDYNSLFNFRIMAWAGLPLFRNIKTGDIATMESLPK